MRGAMVGLIGLALVAAARPAAAGCPDITSAAETLSDEADRLVRAAEQARPGGCLYAADLVAAAHEATAADPRRDLDALHALLTDAVNMYVASHEQGGDPALICEADALIQRHHRRVRTSKRSTFTFEVEITALRSRVHARLAARGETCGHIDAGMVTYARRLVGAPGPGEWALRPGVLAAATRDRRVPSPSPRRWQVAKRAGVGLMAIGLMTLGAGIAAGAAERVSHADLLQASLLVGGTAMFVGGFPLIIIGDQRARAAVAVAPTGVAVKF